MKLLGILVTSFLLCLTIKAAPIANAGADRSCFVYETITLDGSSSTGYIDGMRQDAGNVDRYSIEWSFGYDNWTYSGSTLAPIAYPEAGSYTATLTVCDATSCSSDTALITVNNVTEGSEIVLIDSGNAITNFNNLQTEINNSVGINNRVITLPIGWVSTGELILKHRTVANYLTIRTANFASLPNGTTRVDLSDVANLVTFQTSNNSPIVNVPAPSANPARYYRLIGINLRKTNPSFAYTNSFVNLGTNETSLSQLTNHIIFDHCLFDGGSDTSNTLRGILIRASDFSVVNSYFIRFKGVAIETQAVLSAMGERQALINNFLEASTENYMAGGVDSTISNHNPTDLVFRRNYFKKPQIWNPSDAAYLGVNMSIKNLFELKTAIRVSVQGNRMETHWIEDQPGYAIVITVRNQSGTAPWAQIAYLDFSYNQIHQISRGFNCFGTDELQTSAQTHHIFVKNNVFSGMGYQDPLNNLAIHSDGPQGIDKFFFINNTSDHNGDTGNGWGRTINFEAATKHTNFVYNGNIVQGYINHASGTGNAAFQLATGGSFQAIKNCFHRSVGLNPADNTSVSLIADVKFTNLAGFDLSLANDSPCLNTGLNGGRAGADVAATNDYNLHTIDGEWPSNAGASITKCRWNTSPVCSAN